MVAGVFSRKEEASLRDCGVVRKASEVVRTLHCVECRRKLRLLIGSEKYLVYLTKE
jgi:hypothetical protein